LLLFGFVWVLSTSQAIGWRIVSTMNYSELS